MIKEISGITPEELEKFKDSAKKDFEVLKAAKHIQNYKVKMVGREFFMLMSDIEYRGAAMLATMSNGSIEITPIK
jgi:hypothetical protein